MTAVTVMPMRRELRGPEQRQHLLRHLDGLRHRVAAAADHVVLGHFHDEAALGGHHGQCGMLRRDDPRGQALPKDRTCRLEIGLPEEAVRAHQRILARHAVDDDIDALVGAPDASEQRFHCDLARVIDANRDGLAAGGRDHRRGFVDRLGPAVRRWLPLHTATGAIDRCSGFAERPCDAAASSPRRASDERNASSQRLQG